jgi:ribosome maturation factor RimP
MAGSDVSRRVGEILEGYLREHSLEIYKIEYKKEGADWKLRVYLDKPADSSTEYVSIDECEGVTRFLSDRLDEEDFIDRRYTLEVSSPGLDRELIKPEDFVRFAGRLVDVRLYEPVGGSRELQGTLVGREDGIISIEADGVRHDIPEKKISKISLAVVF